MEHNILTKKLLKKEYCDLGKTQREIGKQYGLSSCTVHIWMKNYGISPRASGRQSPSIKGKKFGKLTILEMVHGSDKKHPGWKCRCDCGENCTAYASSLLGGVKTCCPKCGYKRGGRSKWTGHEEISGKFWSQIKWGAKVRSLKFKINIEYCWKLYLRQNKQCALTGAEIGFNSEITASLDRINSSKGYCVGNVQWVHKRINWMKGDMMETELLDWCNKLITYRELKAKCLPCWNKRAGPHRIDLSFSHAKRNCDGRSLDGLR